MFGSNFAQQFGLFGPPWDNLDAYGGIFGSNAPPQDFPGSLASGEQAQAGASAYQFPGQGSSGGSGFSAGPQGGAGLTGRTPVQGTPGVQPPQATGGPNLPPGTVTLGGGGGPQHLPFANPLSQGPLAAGVNSEFNRG